MCSCFEVLKRGFSFLFDVPKFACSAALAAEIFCINLYLGRVFGMIYIVFGLADWHFSPFFA